MYLPALPNGSLKAEVHCQTYLVKGGFINEQIGDI